MSRITPFLWFNNNAEEAINFYLSVFKNARITSSSRYTEHGPGPEGSLMVATFELDGQKFMALNGGPMYPFTNAISLVVDCDNQDEVDYYWNALTANGGKEIQCGWLTDKFGLPWQVIPKALSRYLSDPDRRRAGQAMQAMFPMKKIIIADLKAAFERD